MDLSIIIPTRNRAQYLCVLFNSLLSQVSSLQNTEIIVVDNASNDDTAAICDQFSKRFYNFSYLYEASPGLHNGRHKGLFFSKSEYITYLDDDVVLFPGFTECVLSSFKDSKTVLVGGKVLPNFEISPPDWITCRWKPGNNGNRTLGYLSLIDLGNNRKSISPFQVFGCNFSIKKSTLLECGGFHPDAMPSNLVHYRGDGETYVAQFIEQSGYQTTYHPGASVFHHVPPNRMTIDYFSTRAFNQGISDSYTLIRRYGGRKPLRSSIFLTKPLMRYLLSQKHDKILYRSYLKGFYWHQHQVIKNKSLYDWVLQRNYFHEDSSMCDLHQSKVNS